MPLTPLHYPLAYLIYKLDRRLPLPALVISAMVPDLEIPVLILLGWIHDRMVLHSITGGVVVGVPLTMVLLGVYRWLIPQIFPVDLEKLSPKCKITAWSILAASIGVLSHVLLDATHHEYNPLLWPFTIESINTLVFVDSHLALQIAHFLMGGLSLVIIFYVLTHYDNFFEETLVG